RLLRPERDRDDLGVGISLEPERRLDGIGVQVVERALAGAVEPLRRRVEARRPLGHVLDADRDPHPGGTLVGPRWALAHMRCSSASTSATNVLLTLYSPCFRTARSPWYQPASARRLSPRNACNRCAR